MEQGTKHTPGPWTVEHTWEGAPPGLYLVVEAQDHIEVEKWANEYESAEQMEEANARLIAAAPEMLDLLAEIAWGDSHPDQYREEAARLHVKARGGEMRE